MMLSLLVAGLCLQSIPNFREEVIETHSGGPGYNSCLADINGDGKMDIVLVTENKDQVLWYENPTWKKHVMTSGLPKLPEPITPFDVDGDGKTEIIVGGDWVMADTLTSGSVWLLKRPENLDQPWTPIQIDQEPSMHRLTVLKLNGKKELVGACLMGRGTKAPDWEGPGAPMYLLRPDGDPFKGPWKREPIANHLHKVHGVTAVDWDDSGNQALLVASFEGIHLFRKTPTGWSDEVLAKGDPKAPGSSEVKVMRLPGGKKARATIDPFHGDVAAVYLSQRSWERRVILVGYKVGHSVVPVDFSGKGVDSLVLGFRGEKGKGGHSVVVLHPLDENGEKWEKKVIDDKDMEADGVHAVDLDGDGRIDIVATGKGTNVKIYWNQGKP
ncbi:MAG: VCBS repeat-containing protein [Planctomycetes bacterium]|nr:VCBS repeat-containing protein [Planctomycetota bacterium]